MSIQVIESKCIGCKLCVKTCAFGAIEVIDKLAVINKEICTLCGACVSSCKFKAIIIEKMSSKKTENFEDYKGISVIAEINNDTLNNVTLEMLGAAQKLAKNLNEKVTAFIIGKNVKNYFEDLTKFGADKIIYVENDILDSYNDEIFSYIFTRLLKKYKPEIVLTGATAFGRALAPRVAVALRTGLTADCTELEIDLEKRNLLQTRPAFGGNIMATILCPNHRPQMATVRAKVMKKAEKNNAESEKIEEKIDFNKINTKINILEKVNDEYDTINIADAEIIVSGGRGMGKPENFELLKKLAKLIGGAVGASRAVVDAGWIDYSHQVGQTGKTVQPKIYIACGISGAIQHLAGMQSSDIIIAVNKDKDAPIFKAADVGIIGDTVEIISELIKELEKMYK